MTVDVELLTFDVTSDGQVGGVVDSLTVSDGALYYVEEMVVDWYADGDSTQSGFFTVEASVRDVFGEKRATASKQDDLATQDSLSVATKTLGRYLYPGESVVIEELRDDLDTGAAMRGYVKLRRVL